VNTNGAHQLLVVDDEEPARRLLARILQQDGYQCDQAADVTEALEQVSRKEFALVITDLDMPGASGLELIRHLTSERPTVATMMVTGKGDREIAHRVVECGAYGYLSKPLDPDEVVINVYNALLRRSLELENQQHRDKLEEMIKSRTSDLWETSLKLEHALAEAQDSQEETIRRLALAAELRDTETGAHNQRMSEYCHLLASRLEGVREIAETIRLGSLLHDIGKIAVPDGILLKEGPLTHEERSIIEQHAEVGYQILKDSGSRLLQMGATIARTHHEKCDGTGYPRRLTRAEIPIEGRIAAVADVFDALTSNRPYRTAYSVTQAGDIMREAAGPHLDEEFVDLFLSDLRPILEIMETTGGAILI